MKMPPLYPAFAIALLTTACGGGDPEAAGDPAITLSFATESGGNPVDCSTSFEAGTGAGSFGISDLKMFISDIELIDASGSATPLALTADDTWQTESIALLDFEDKSAGCSNGTERTNTVIHGTAPDASYSGIRFTVGVPFSDNHADPSQATGPLTFTSMHWGWQGGYKFMRIDITERDGNYRLHLGSTGCEGTIGAITSCSRPNRPRIELTDFDPATQTIVLNLDQLFAQTDLTANAEGTTTGCMGSEIDPDCEGPFAELGLDFQTGEPSGPATAFMVK
jgi:uncharacterized repeat protein (TIGR04052 family)